MHSPIWFHIYILETTKCRHREQISDCYELGWECYALGVCYGLSTNSLHREAGRSLALELFCTLTVVVILKTYRYAKTA